MECSIYIITTHSRIFSSWHTGVVRHRGAKQSRRLFASLLWTADRCAAASSSLPLVFLLCVTLCLQTPSLEEADHICYTSRGDLQVIKSPSSQKDQINAGSQAGAPFPRSSSPISFSSGSPAKIFRKDFDLSADLTSIAVQRSQIEES